MFPPRSTSFGLSQISCVVHTRATSTRTLLFLWSLSAALSAHWELRSRLSWSSTRRILHILQKLCAVYRGISSSIRASTPLQNLSMIPTTSQRISATISRAFLPMCRTLSKALILISRLTKWTRITVCCRW